MRNDIFIKNLDNGRWCNVCRIHFKYPSKLKHHLQTAKHELYDANFISAEAIGIDIEEDSEDDTVSDDTI